MIHCKKCGWVPVPEKDLPVELPNLEDFHPDGSGKGPLNKVPDFVNTICPTCGGKAQRETDVSDPFVDSAWYFFRYLSTENKKEALNKEMIKKWMPIDMYIGGKEHTVLHLLYSRFITMVLYDFGYCEFEEPFKRFFGHGLVIKDGAKMSKSKGNVVNPDEYLEKFGADSVRMYLMFLGDVRQGGDWKDAGIAGISRFLKRVFRIYEEFLANQSGKKTDPKTATLPNATFFHKTIKGVTTELLELRFNTAIAKIMELVNWYYKDGANLSVAQTLGFCKTLAVLIGPFAPHLAEEFWHLLGEKDSVFKTSWPKADPAFLLEKEVKLVVQINGKMRSLLLMATETSEEEALSLALADLKIKKFIGSSKIKKTIYLKGRVLNLVI
jgi:leucyl-tRNA synthetase